VTSILKSIKEILGILLL